MHLSKLAVFALLSGCLVPDRIPRCTPGIDQTCDDLDTRSTIAGRCEADGTCTCVGGYQRSPVTGKCGPGAQDAGVGIDGGSAVCVPGADQTCNDDPPVSAFEGHCEATGACTCNPDYWPNPLSGRCSLVKPCENAGDVGPCSNPFTATAMGMCTLEKICWCFAGSMVDPDSRRCALAQPPCTLGADQTCNDLPTMSAFAGSCVVMGPGRGCSCNDGFDTNPATGRCRPAAQ